MTNAKFEFYIGDTYTRDFTISGYSSEISEVFFTVKKNVSDKHAALQKTLSDGGINLVDEVYDGEGNILSRTYNILINANDTENMKPDIDYVFDIEIVTPELVENIKKTIMTGTFKLNNTATRVYNEG